MSVKSAGDLSSNRKRVGLWRFVGVFSLGFLLGVAAGGIGVGRALIGRPQGGQLPNGYRTAPIFTSESDAVESSMDDVLEIARTALQQMRLHLDDYTATLVKQEAIGDELGEPEQMAIKVQCRHRGGDIEETQPMRVYLRFELPKSAAGREVIWAEDMHDGKLVVHEAGLLGLMTVRLDPTGMIAMRGQRYPIYDIGLTNLVKKLIERGSRDRDNPGVTVRISHDLEFDGQRCDLIVVTRSQPSGHADDFSRAEVWFDRRRQLPLRYVAYGWPIDQNERSMAEALPILESYTYLDVKTNVGLSESDFDPKNPEYRFN